MLATGALGGIIAGAGGAAVGGGPEGVCAGAVLASEARCRGCETAGLAAVCFGAFTRGVAASAAVAFAAGTGFALAIRCDCAGALDAVCRSVAGVGLCAWVVPCAFGGCRVTGRSSGGAAVPEFGERSKLGTAWGGPSESMTLSFTTTSGVVVCAAAGTTGTASSAPVRIAARQAVSRSEADAEYLPMPEPQFFPTRATAPAHPAPGQNTAPGATPLLRDFARAIRCFRRPSWPP